MVLLVLAALWAVVLLPPLLRSRTRNTRTVDSIGEFNYKLGVLSRTNGAAPAPRAASQPIASSPARVSASSPAMSRAPRPTFAPGASASQRAAKRRGDVLRVLVTAVALTMALAYFTGAPLLWGVQLATDVALAAFLGLWAYIRNAQPTSTEPVRYLHQSRTPEFALRRTASS